MQVLIQDSWQDYELLDSGDGRRLERFGKYVLVRPDPEVIWKPSLPESEWQKAEAIFDTSTALSKDKGNQKGEWKRVQNISNNWQIAYRDLKFLIKLTSFKHTGIFPEQAVQWDWMNNLINGARGDSEEGPLRRARNPELGEGEDGRRDTGEAGPGATINVLNLFGYTGAASLIAAKAGAKVTHVDASFPTIGWARENQKLSGLDDKPIRWILDDCLKFCQREIKRGVKYDGIIMDPPVYGHGPKGEVWDFNKSFPKLMEACKQILSDTPLFFIVNAYAVSTSSITLENVLRGYLKNLDGEFESGELALKDRSGKLLSTGIFARWSKI